MQTSRLFCFAFSSGHTTFLCLQRRQFVVGAGGHYSSEHAAGLSGAAGVQRRAATVSMSLLSVKAACRAVELAWQAAGVQLHRHGCAQCLGNFAQVQQGCNRAAALGHARGVVVM